MEDYGGVVIRRMDTHDTRQWCCVEGALDYGMYLFTFMSGKRVNV